MTMSAEKLIIRFISDNPSCNGSAIRAHLSSKDEDMSQSSFSRLMVQLEKSAQVKKTGKAKGVSYFLTPLQAHLSVPSALRSKAPYSDSVISSVKNDNCLSEEEKDLLLTIGSPDDADLSTLSLEAYYQFILDLSYSSSKLEGNVYTYIDTDVLLKYNEYADGKPQIDGTMIINHKHALEYILSNIDTVDIDLKTIRDIHSLLSVNLPGVTVQEQGACRTRMVQMNGSSFEPLNDPLKIPLELDRLLDRCRKISNPFEQSIYLLGVIPYLQAFVDVNKRVGRLMCNIPLIKAGLAPFSFIDMDKKSYTKGIISLYELRDISLLKNSYIAAYQASSPDLVASLNNAVKGQVNPLSLMYRKEISLVVAKTIKTEFELNLIEELLLLDVKEEEADNVKDIVLNIVDNLHEGAVAAYNVTKDELDAYRDRELLT